MRLSKLLQEWDGPPDQFQEGMEDISYDRLEDRRKYQRLFEKVKILYDYKWKVDSRLSMSLTETIERWLENFDTGDQRIAFELLCKIIHYDITEMEVLSKVTFKKLMESFNVAFDDRMYIPFMNRHVAIMSFNDGGLEWFKTLRHFSKLGDRAFKLRFVDFTDSDFLSLQAIVFVEDFLSSGNTIITDYNNLKPEIDKIKEKCPNLVLYCFSLIATRRGIEMIEQGTEFKVVAGEVLDVNCKAFSENSIIYPIQHEREMAKQVFERYGTKLGLTSPLGYNNDQLTVVLWNNTPDNSLPVIWFESEGWFPFFKRYPRYHGN